METGREKESVNAKTAQLVKLLCEVGPDVPEISKRLGQFKESVRYRYKEKILNRGFAVQASVDHERLGLKRLVAFLDFSPEYSQFAESILTSLHELCYLVGFVKTMPGGFYIVNFSVPREHMPAVVSFLEKMKAKSMFSKLELMEYDWFRSAPMKADSYDFDTGRWDFDWSGNVTPDYESARFAPSEPAQFDNVDLLIIKELQMDANKSLKEVSDAIKVNYKKLAWHYSSHVLGRKLIRGYSVNWMGTSYDYGLEKVLHRQHRYLALQLVVRDASELEIISVRQVVNRLPFLWSESVGKSYSCEFAFPVDSLVEGFQYLRKAVGDLKERAELLILDQTEAVSFTIPYYRYDQATRRWTFDSPELVRKFDELIVQIKKETH